MRKLFENITAGAGKCLALFLVCAMCSPLFVHAQADVHFSQFYETSVLRNPGLTGVMADDYKFGVYYRNQWSSVSNPFQTVQMSAETHVPVSSRNDDFFSCGLLGYFDQAGDINQKISAVYLALGYNKSLSSYHSTYLSVGFTGGYLQYSVDASKATFNNQFQNGQFDPNNPVLEALPNAKFNALDAGAGINFNTSSGYDNKVTYIIGVSGYHFNLPKFSYYQIPNLTQEIRWNVNIGMSCALSNDLNLMIQGNYATEGTYKEPILGALLGWTAIAQNTQGYCILSAGVFYRYQDAIIPIIKLKYGKMALGISYDVNISTLKDASNMAGGYEITLFYSGRYPKDDNRQKVCPRF